MTSWSATGIGRSTLAVMLRRCRKGGHLRVGMEDVLTIARGVPVESNAQLVERAVALGGGPAHADVDRGGPGAARREGPSSSLVEGALSLSRGHVPQ